jgi:hypothetical protein
MSWRIGAVAVVAVSTLVMGCAQSPARQGVGVARAPSKAPAQRATPSRAQAQLANAPVMSDYDPNRWVDIELPPTRRQERPRTRAAGPGDLRPGVGPAGGGVSSVRYAPPQPRARPDGVLSITQVELDSPLDPVDALERRLSRAPRAHVVTVRLPRGAVSPE